MFVLKFSDLSTFTNVHSDTVLIRSFTYFSIYDSSGNVKPKGTLTTTRVLHGTLSPAYEGWKHCRNHHIVTYSRRLLDRSIPSNMVFSRRLYIDLKYMEATAGLLKHLIQRMGSDFESLSIPKSWLQELNLLRFSRLKFRQRSESTSAFSC